MTQKKKKHYFFKVTEYHGEKEMTFNVVFRLDPEFSLDTKIDMLMSEWYDHLTKEKPEATGIGTSWDGGDFFCVPEECREIPEEHFNVLKEYLTEL